MAQVAGALEIQMFAGIARLQKDMDGARRVVGDAVRDIERALGAVGIAFSAHMLIGKIESVIDSMAKLQDASEKTGASVESLSKLQFFSGVSGSSIDSVTQALARLSKGISGSSAEMAPATQALKFLGLSAKDAAGNLKNPAVLFGEIAQKLIGYQDGAGKAAIAQALFGKAGAEMLPTLKKMAELGEIGASVTTEQAKAAEAFSIELARLNQQKLILWNTFVSALLPTMGSLVEMLLNASKETDSLGGKVKGFAADHSIENWADASAMGVARLVDIIKTLGTAGDQILAPMQRYFLAAQAGYAAITIMASGESEAVKNSALMALRAQAAATNAELQARMFKGGFGSPLDINTTTSENLARVIALRKANAQDAARDMEGASRGESPGKPLNFMLGDAKLAAAELKLFEGAMQSLEKQYFNMTHAGELALIMYETTKGTLKKLTPEHKAELLVMAEKIDAYRRLITIQGQSVELIKSLTGAQEKAREVELDYAAAQRLELENLGFTASLIGKTTREQELMTAARQIDLDLRKQIASLPKDESGDLLPGAFAAAERMRTMADEQKRAVLIGLAERQNAEREFVVGAKAAFNEYTDNATNAARQAKDAVTNSFKALEDALFQFIRHGKLGITDFIGVIKDQFARLAAQQITLQIVGSVGMSGAAGAAGGAMSGLSLASGANTVSGWFGGPNIGNAVQGWMGGPLSSAVVGSSGIGGAGFAGASTLEEAAQLASMGGTAGAAGGVMGAIGTAMPYIGAALLAYSLLSGSGDNRNAEPAGPPDQFRTMFSANRSGLITPAGYSLQGKRVDGGQYSDNAMLDAASAQQVNNAVVKLFADYEKAAKDAGLSTAALAGAIETAHSSTLSGSSAQDTYGKALASLSDNIALALVPTLAETQMMGESLTNTFARLTAATTQAKLAADAAAEAEAKAAIAKAQAAAIQTELDHEAAVTSAVDALRESYQRESADLTAMIGRWHDAGAALRAYSATLAGGAGVGPSYGVASSAFGATAASARLGDLTAIGNLQAVSETFRTASLAASSTQTDYLRDIGRIQAAIADTVGVTDRQGSVAQQQLDGMRTQVSSLIDINDSVKSVTEAIADVRAELASLRASSDRTAASTAAQESFWRRLSPNGQSLQTVAA